MFKCPTYGVSSLHDRCIFRFKCFLGFFIVPKKSESADIEEPKVENEGTIEEELNVHISPTPVERKSPTSKISKVEYFLSLKHVSRFVCLRFL